MTDPRYEEIATVSELLANREVSPVELTQALLERIAMLDGGLRSYVCVTGEGALAAARQAEREIAHGAYRGALHGVPIAIKGLFWTQDAPTAEGMASPDE
jgi:amidase